MKIYVVIHSYDNGESYEDYREYKDYMMFSTYQKASYYFWNHVVDDYMGKFTLIEWELDTQERKTLEESVYIKCISCWDTISPDYSEEDYYCNEPGESYDLWDCAKYESIQEELKDEYEWLTHKGENYEIFKQLERDKEEDLLKELEAQLDLCLQ